MLAVKTFYRLVGLVVLGAVAFVALGPLLPPGTELGGATTPSFDDIMKAASEIGDDVKEVTEALRGSVGGAQGEEALVSHESHAGEHVGATRESYAEARRSTLGELGVWGRGE